MVRKMEPDPIAPIHQSSPNAIMPATTIAFHHRSQFYGRLVSSPYKRIMMSKMERSLSKSFNQFQWGKRSLLLK